MYPFFFLHYPEPFSWETLHCMHSNQNWMVGKKKNNGNFLFEKLSKKQFVRYIRRLRTEDPFIFLSSGKANKDENLVKPKFNVSLCQLLLHTYVKCWTDSAFTLNWLRTRVMERKMRKKNEKEKSSITRQSDKKGQPNKWNATVKEIILILFIVVWKTTYTKIRTGKMLNPLFNEQCIKYTGHISKVEAPNHSFSLFDV